MTICAKVLGVLIVAVGVVPPATLADVKPVNAAALQFTFPGAAAAESVALDGFLVDGHRLTAANKLQARQLAEGVSEVTAEAAAVGDWQFAVHDQSSYYGFGERFDRLNHAHTIVKNASRDAPDAKGALSYQPVPFFMSTRGYGLWVDSYGEVTFDLNVTERYSIVIHVPAKRLRLVLFEGPKFPTILERFTAQAGRQQLPPYWAFAPWKARDYHRNQATGRWDCRPR